MAQLGRNSARSVLVLTVVATTALGLNLAIGSPGGNDALADVACGESSPSSPSSSPSASPSASNTGGGLPIPTLLPSSSPSPSGSASPSPSGSPSTMPEPGQTERCDSQINIRFRRVFNDSDPRSAFVGLVSSESDSCQTARPVVVKKVKKGTDDVVARTTTNEKGRYRAFERRPRGRFYAKVLKSEGANGGSPVLCLGDRSRTIRVP